ncbi:MAG: lipid biosynthesis B12-binding/radical SAM protein [Calditrichaceae bacterium]
MIAEAARLRGYEVFEWDMLINKNSLDDLGLFIKKHQPNFVGMSLRNIDSVNFNQQESYISNYQAIAAQVRKVSDAKIILGGSAFTILPEETLSSIDADYGIVGEGEFTFCELIENINAGKTIHSNIIHSTQPIDGDQILTIGRNKELAEFYLKKGGMLNVQTKRGCPHRCAYCSYPVLEGRVYRQRQATDVVDEIEMLIKDYQADYYAITDSVFNDSTNEYLQIAEELVQREITIPWMCFLRPDNFKPDEVKLLKRAGLTSVEWGTDCASDTTLAAMQKDFNWDEVLHSNNLFAEHEIANGHFIIFGGPGETKQTVKEGLTNIDSLKDSVVFGSIGVRVFPYTQMYERAMKEKIINEDTDLLEPVFYFSPDVEHEWMHQQILESFNGRADRIYPGGLEADKTSAFHLFGYRGPVWDYILKKGKTRRKKHDLG